MIHQPNTLKHIVVRYIVTDLLQKANCTYTQEAQEQGCMEACRTIILEYEIPRELKAECNQFLMEETNKRIEARLEEERRLAEARNQRPPYMQRYFSACYW